jgi:competence protein ComEC
MAVGAAMTVYLRVRRVSALLYFVFFTAGLVAFISRTGINPEMADTIGERTVIRGMVVDESATRRGFRLIVELENDVRIAVQTMNEGPVGTGGIVEFEAVPEELSRIRDPGGFDEYLYFRARDVHFKTFVRELTPEPGPFSLLVLRGRVSAVYDRLLPWREAGLMKAMIIGDTTALGSEIQELYRVAGIYHMLSISGLHISALAWMINFLLIRLIGRRQSGLVTIGFLVFYCIFTGMSPPAVRAGIMGSVIILGDIIFREKDALSATAFAAVLILLWQPLFLFDVGFQYSFIAVFGLVAIAAPMSRVLHIAALNTPVKLSNSKISCIYTYLSNNRKIPKLLTDTFAVSLVASFVTVPVSAWHFYHVMPYGIAANLIIAPTSALVTIAGFFAGILGLFAEPLAAIPAGVAYAMFKFYESVCELLTIWPGSAILTGRGPAALVAGWYIPVVAAGVYFSGRAKKRPKAVMPTARLARLLSIWMAAYAALAFVYSIPRSPQVYRLSDSDGVIVRQGREALVFDSGADARALKGYLDYHGVRRAAYFGMHDKLNRADAAIDRLGNIYALFVRPELSELRYYESRGIQFTELTPGNTLRKGEVIIHITDGYGVTIKTGEDAAIRLFQ